MYSAGLGERGGGGRELGKRKKKKQKAKTYQENSKAQCVLLIRNEKRSEKKK